MTRITNRNLELVVKLINKATGNNPAPYTTTDGKLRANIGNYHIDGAYGGVALDQMANEGGGVRDVFSCGHVPKRELYNRMTAYLEGIRCHVG